MNKNKDRFPTTTAISKRANANLGIRISKHTISRRLNEINLHSRVASTKLYISNKNKISSSKFPLNTSYRLKNNGIVFISAMSQSLTCSVVTGEGLFDAVLRNNIRLSAQKAVLDLEEEAWWCLAWFLLLLQDSLSCKLTQLYTKRYWRNMLYLFWELQLIKQLYLCKITLHVTQQRLLRHFFLGRMLLLWSGLFKTQTWILLRIFGSY